MLYDAVLFGVISILYEYEEETLESLAFKLKKALNGRLAKLVVNCFFAIIYCYPLNELYNLYIYININIYNVLLKHII